MIWWNTGVRDEFDNHGGTTMDKTNELPFTPYTLSLSADSTFLEKRLSQGKGVLYLSVMLNPKNINVYFNAAIFKLYNTNGDEVCSLLVKSKTEGKKTYLEFDGNSYYIDYALYGSNVWKQIELEYNTETKKINIWINGINYLNLSANLTDEIVKIRQSGGGIYTNFVYSDEGRIGNKVPIRIYAIDKGQKAEIEKAVKYNGVLEEHGYLSTDNQKRIYIVFQPVESDGILNSITVDVGVIGTFEIVVFDENAGILTVTHVSDEIEIKTLGLQEITELPNITVTKGQYIGIRTNTLRVKLAGGLTSLFVNGRNRYMQKNAAMVIGETIIFSSMSEETSIFGYSYAMTNKEDFYKILQAGYGLDAEKASYITFSGPEKQAGITLDKIISEEFTSIRGIKVFFMGQMGNDVTKIETSIDNITDEVELPTIASPCTIVIKKDYLVKDFVGKEIKIMAR